MQISQIEYDVRCSSEKRPSRRLRLAGCAADAFACGRTSASPLVCFLEKCALWIPETMGWESYRQRGPLRGEHLHQSITFMLGLQHCDKLKTKKDVRFFPKFPRLITSL